jgi:hypothetical protein
MAGILDYRNYLNTLQTLTDVGNIFPSDQKTMNFSLPGGGVDGWTAEISWMTLIIDNMTWTADQTPDFTETGIFGYYLGGTASQVSNGVISIPANMYTGPILPTQEYHVPITVVNVRWTKDGDTYAQNLAWIQNWEPGVLLGDPVYGEGFIPIVKEQSALTLSGPGAIVWQSVLTLQATTSIPIDLGPFAIAYFFWDRPTGGRVLLGGAFFDNSTKTATLNYSTAGTSLLFPGTYPIYAEFSGVRQFGFQRSNTIQQVVIDQIPLVLENETVTPNKSIFTVGENLEYFVKFKPDPSFPVTGNPVTNLARVFRRDITTPGLPNPPSGPDVLLGTANFVDGAISVTQPITANLVDTSAFFTNADNITVTTSTLVNNVYSYTATIGNSYRFFTSYDADLAGPYRAGSYAGRQFAVNATVSRSITGQAFPMTLTWAASNLGLLDYSTWPTLAEINNFLAYLQAGNFQPSTGQINYIGIGFYIINYEVVAFKESRVFVSYPGPSWTAISEYEAKRTQFQNTQSGTFLGQTATFTISTPRTFRAPITLIASNATTSTLLGQIAPGPGGDKVINSNVLTTGTWTVTASFPGDLGLGITPDYQNLASTSNSVTLFVRQGNDLPVTLEFDRSNTNDIITAVTPITSQLVRDVSFFNGVSFINTASWARALTTSTIISTTTFAAITDTFVISSQVLGAAPGPGVGSLTGGWVSEQATTSDALFPNFKSLNKYTLFRYKGTETSTSSYLANPLDPINVEPINATTINSYPGDSRGYNVIALSTKIDTLPRTLNYGVNGRSIELVEYIGAGTPFRHLYRFTPEIPQTSQKWNVFFPTNVIIPSLLGTGNVRDRYRAEEYQNLVWMNTDSGYGSQSRLVNGQWTWVLLTTQTVPASLLTSDGRLQAWLYYATYLDYGRKVWVSLNTSDPIENEIAARANEWFSVATNPRWIVQADIPAKTVTTLTTVTDFLNYQVASLFLDKDTVVNPSVLRAEWPGTLDLDVQFGRWNPFDIGVGLPASSVKLLPTFDLVVVGARGGVDGQGNFLSNAWTKPNKTSNAIFDNNDYYLTALVEIAPSFIGTASFATTVSGTVDFINADTGGLIGVASVTTDVPRGYENYQGVARLKVNASDIVNTSGSYYVNLKAVYTSGNASTSTSDMVLAQVVKSSYGMIPFTYTNFPQPSFGGMIYNKTYIGPDNVIGEIIRSPVGVFERSDYVGKTGDVTLSGSLNYIFPATNYRGETLVSNPRIDDYPGNEGGTGFEREFYGTSFTLYSQFRTGFFYELETATTTSTGLVTLANTSINYFDHRQLSVTGPTAGISRSISSKFIMPGVFPARNLRWSDNWVRIRVYQSVATYWLLGTTIYNSSLGLGGRLGFNSNLTL